MSDPRTQLGQDLSVTTTGPRDEPPAMDTQPIWTGGPQGSSDSGYPTGDTLSGYTEYGDTEHRDVEYQDPEYARPDQEEVGPSRQPAPITFGGWLGATMALLCTAGAATLIGWLPYLPAGETRGWAVVYNLLDVDGPRTVAAWWGTVLAVLVAVWSWAAAGRARRSHAWLRWLAWSLVGLTGLLYSASQLLALPETTRGLPFVAELGLPALVTENPVESLLLTLLAAPALVLLISGRSSQRVLLLLGAGLAATGWLLIGSGRPEVIAQGHHRLLAEVVCGWLAMVCVLFAASLERLRRDRAG